ncbi:MULTISPECIES: CheR family methyltransferase [Chelativorans]|jgi:chemotaxis protein methyltransferase CheR|uniref:MCP methyltransferase, CheR-type n=1 Tax=Chelativorans sp. (strain BNC1) TaxID=266779 RepID=Q11GY9_CHESB|nr:MULTISPECIES: CheR family methyltransferase [Chelativorans]
MTTSTEEIEIGLLLEAIRQRYHYDFRGYSQLSIARRLKRAQQHFGCRSLSMLQDKVLHDSSILPDLLNHLTIQVSEMFRDPAYFRALRETVLPHLKTYPSLKVWVAGCAAGEELYSLAILFREEGLDQRTIFYATDINPDALRKAEAGIYELDRIALFTENHRLSGSKVSLSEYYTAAYGAAVFDRTLRFRTVFAEHNLAADAVFAEVNLISCRNVLIYFDRELQDRAIGLFKDSLAHGGFLGLGTKESLRFSSHGAAFQEFAGQERIYRMTTHDTSSRRVDHAVA